MNFKAAVGSAQALDGREAAIVAVHQALRQLEGVGDTALALIFAAQELDLNAVLNGASGLLGSTPLWGMSTVRPFTSEGPCSRSVVVLLISGDDLKAQPVWIPESPAENKTALRQLNDVLKKDGVPQLIWMGGDGAGSDCAAILHGLPALEKTCFAGGLASGNFSTGKTWQICGNQIGSGGSALMLFNTPLHIGIGMAHGWQPVGRYFSVSRVNQCWLRTLDNQTPAEVYSEVFGGSPREWTQPPLADLLRMYPLEIEEEGTVQRMVCSPLLAEADGSFRFNTVLPQHSTAHLLIASMDTCLSAVQSAVDAAKAALAPAHPLFAVVFADTAWQLIFESHPGAEIKALSDALGEIPLAGAYTLGQFGGTPPQLFNQHIQVVLFGAE